VSDTTPATGPPKVKRRKRQRAGPNLWAIDAKHFTQLRDATWNAGRAMKLTRCERILFNYLADPNRIPECGAWWSDDAKFIRCALLSLDRLEAKLPIKRRSILRARAGLIRKGLLSISTRHPDIGDGLFFTYESAKDAEKLARARAGLMEPTAYRPAFNYDEITEWYLLTMAEDKRQVWIAARDRRIEAQKKRASAAEMREAERAKKKQAKLAAKFAAAARPRKGKRRKSATSSTKKKSASRGDAAAARKARAQSKKSPAIQYAIGKLHTWALKFYLGIDKPLRAMSAGQIAEWHRLMRLPENQTKEGMNRTCLAVQ